jgi:excisionase family DNA binding protein
MGGVERRAYCIQVSVTEAARLLGVSVATVRRRIRVGQLEAEAVIRP